MSAAIQAPFELRDELVNWRERLEAATRNSVDQFELHGLLREVNATIERLSERETYGVCQVCHELIETAAMRSDPLRRSCLSCLTAEQLDELDRDLDRAWLIQGELLPKENFNFNGWTVSYHYEPAGRVSGDYCDLVSTDAGELFFMIGDVSGKGVAASLLMSRLHAIFRSFICSGLRVGELVEKTNQIFAETTMRPYYATLVCGKADPDGAVELCNAGHCAPLLLSTNKAMAIPATGLPVGMFCEERYESSQFNLKRGDQLFLYTDGLSEARNAANDEFGADRLHSLLQSSEPLPVENLVNRILDQVREFASGVRLGDDLTIMAIEKTSQLTK